MFFRRMLTFALPQVPEGTKRALLLLQRAQEGKAVVKIVHGDIWHLWGGNGFGSAAIVVPTNVGWTRTGRNVMGRGLALDASKRWPKLASWYGWFCKLYGPNTFLTSYEFDLRLILFPVKPLNEYAPQLSWKSKADLKMIESSAETLAKFGEKYPTVFVPIVGTGNGGLDEKDVMPILERHLSDDRFLLVKKA